MCKRPQVLKDLMFLYIFRKDLNSKLILKIDQAISEKQRKRRVSGGASMEGH